MYTETSYVFQFYCKKGMFECGFICLLLSSICTYKQQSVDHQAEKNHFKYPHVVTWGCIFAICSLLLSAMAAVGIPTRSLFTKKTNVFFLLLCCEYIGNLLQRLAWQAANKQGSRQKQQQEQIQITYCSSRHCLSFSRASRTTQDMSCKTVVHV